MKVCSVVGCDRPFSARDLCRMHYARLRRYGDPLLFGKKRRAQQQLVGCSVEGCDRLIHAQGLCPLHYQRMTLTGTTHRTTVADRLAAMLVVMPSGCIEWTGLTQFGYGRIKTAGRTLMAHRVAWELTNGPIPPGLILLHSCDNRPCCNLDHLSIGTYADNNADMMAKGRGVAPWAGMSHCRNGHEYVGTNVRVTPAGTRKCRICKRVGDARRRSEALENNVAV